MSYPSLRCRGAVRLECPAPGASRQVASVPEHPEPQMAVAASALSAVETAKSSTLAPTDLASPHPAASSEPAGLLPDADVGYCPTPCRPDRPHSPAPTA